MIQFEPYPFWDDPSFLNPKATKRIWLHSIISPEQLDHLGWLKKQKQNLSEYITDAPLV